MIAYADPLPAVTLRRGAVVTNLVNDLTRSYLILAAWTVAGWAMTVWVVGRRK